MPHLTSRFSVLCLCSLLLCSSCATAAEVSFLGLAAIGAAPWTAAEPEPTVEPPVVTDDITETSPPFVIGRDNLGFPNPSGAVRMGSMAGNCYTMAFVARMFFEKAQYRASDSSRRGFSRNALADCIDGTTTGRFDVFGYPSLYAMTSSTAVPANQLDNWMDAETRRRRGIAQSGSVNGAPANADELVSMYELVSTIHYLHYMQVQAPYFLENIVGPALAGNDTPARKNKTAAEDCTAALRENILPLLLIWNPDEVFGHVVLAYRTVRPRAGGHTDIYVYDSNAQYGPTMDESILRIDDSTGRYSLHWKRKSTGAIEASSMYSGSSWFTGPRCYLAVLPQPYGNEAERKTLANRLRNTSEGTGYLLASGDLLTRLTTVSPQTSPLLEDTRRFLHDLEAVHGGLGINGSIGSIAGCTSRQQINEYLANNTDRAVQIVFPYALPRGVSLSDTSLQFTSDNEARLRTKLTIDKNAPTAELIDAIKRSACFAKDEALATLVENLRDAFAGQRLTVEVELSLTKGNSPDPKFGKYFINPILLSSHVVVGDLATATSAVNGDHVIEISESFLAAATRSAVADQGILHTDHPIEYDIWWFGTRHRKGSARLSDLWPECSPGKLLACTSFHVFAPVTGEAAGVNVSSNRLQGAFTFTPRGHNVFRIGASFSSNISMASGCGLLDGLVNKAIAAFAEAALDDLRAGMETTINDQLKNYVELSSGSSISVRSHSVSSTRLSFTLDPFDVDLDKTVKRFLGNEIPATVKEVRVTDDRLILVLDNGSTSS